MSEQIESDNPLNNTVSEVIDLGKSIEEVLPTLDGQETLCEGAFTWHIDDWEQLTQEKHVSPRYRIGNFEWDVLLFPQGNHNKGLAMYLEPHPETQSNEETQKLELADPDWAACAQFAIAISKPGEDKSLNLVNVSSHRFCPTDTDWGFSNFIDLDYLKFYTRSRPSGFLSEGKLNISVFVRILKDPTGVLWHNFMNYDSKKVTGYVGFKNQGATCYLNSLLQSYFFTKYFRKLVYQIPTDKESPNNSVPLALQRAFFQLQKSNEPLDTLELTRSFGWDTGDAFTQHDVQELNRILMDRLENKMKGTDVDGKLNEVFVGKMKSYIKCVNVDYESSRVEDFWDIQLNVKNLRGLQESFKNYIEVEMMDGENQYAAQGYGLQDAKKGVVFESFPPVLHLQLKRFEYDFNYDQLIKINDRYEFPESIDLSPYLDPEISSSNADSYIYDLHGVLVHTGDISTGHYYTMIKPSIEDQWYRFDDDKVWRVTKNQVFEENFGHVRLPDEKLRTFTREQYQNYLISRQTSAYMLVYVRKDMEDKILQEVEDSDVPQHIVTSIENEKQESEKRRKELEEMHLYTTVHVHSMHNFINFQGFDISPNERSKLYSPELHQDNEYSLALRFLRSTKMDDLFREINKTLEVPDDKLVQYWTMAYRKNYTLRLDCPVSHSSDGMTLEQVMKSIGAERASSIDLFIEESYYELNYLSSLHNSGKLSFSGMNAEFLSEVKDKVSRNELPDSREYLKPTDDPHRILIFLKFFDIGKQKLQGFSHATVRQTEEIKVLANSVSSMFENNFPVKFYEEVQPELIEEVDSNQQFVIAELYDGDILTFQNVSSRTLSSLPYHENVTEFYDFLRYRIKITLSRTEESDEEYVLPADKDTDEIEFWVSSRSSYKELSKIISSFVNAKPDYIRVFAVYPNGRFSMSSESSLDEYLIKNYTKDTIPPFEYEILSITLRELEHLRSIKFYWMTDSYVHYHPYEFRLTNSCTVKEFLDKLQKRIGFSDEDKASVLLWTNHEFKFQGVLSEENTFAQINESYLIFGRVLPEEFSLVRQLEKLTPDGDESMDEEEDLSVVRQKSAPVNGRLVIVLQYFRDFESGHGISFLFNLIPDENFIDTKKRLHSKFGLGQKEFSKIKLGIMMSVEGGSRFKSLHGYDDETLNTVVLYDVMNNLDCICMDHPDRSRAQTYHDRPMVIKN